MSERWRRRPVLAWLVRVSVLLLPAVATVVTVVAVDAALPSTVDTGLRVGVLLVTAALVAVAASSVSRRLLPLGFLLDLDLLVPEALPSRYRIALRSGSTRALDEVADLDAATAIASLARAISTHDRSTRGHSERVRAYAELIAVEAGLTPDELDRFRWAALLHDVGKLAIPPAVITKPAALDDAEWELVRRHPEEGHRLIRPLAAWLGPFADTVLHHHERFDGAGYPRGLAGTEISLGARIVAVADAYEVMTSSGRVYRSTLSPSQAREELALAAGTHFDPEVVRAFLAIPLAELRRVAGVAGWLAGALATLRLTAPTPPAGADAAGGVDAALRSGPPLGARLPDGAAPAGQSSVDAGDDLDVDEAAAAQDR